MAHDAKRHDLGAVLRAAGAQGAVQPVSAKSKEIAFHNVITHALAAAAPAGSGKSSAFIKAAAVAAVHTHMKRPTPSLLKEAAEEAADEDEGPADREFNLLSNLADVNPTKVLVKMYMESECPLCRHYATRFLPHILNATGLADVVDFEYIAFGLGHIEEQARKGNKTVDEVLNTTDELNPELHHLIEDSKADAAKLEIICKNGETECEGNGWEACLQVRVRKSEKRNCV